MKTSIFLVSFGGPRRPEEIPLFLTNLIGRTVPPSLAEAATERYATIGGFSPLPEISDGQAALLKEAFPDCAVKAVFRYTYPTIEEGINDARSSGMERLVFLIMTPFYNGRTVETYIRVADSYLALLSFNPHKLFLHTWYKEPLFTECWTRKIREETVPEEEAFYLFSAHSLPVKESEPYREQVEEAMEAIARACSLHAYGLAWQSIPPVINEPWLEPKVETVMDGAMGKFSKIIQIPLGFVTDHLETLYDVDQVHRQYAVGKGFTYQRISSLNTYSPFMDLLKQILAGSLQSP